VIEHVPRERQSEFVRKLGRLLKPGGHVILTTPRGESLQEWARLWGNPGQPVEDWLVEPALRQLFVRENFDVAGHEWVLFDTARRQFVSGDEAKTANDLLAIYQVWAFQLPESQVALAVPPIVRPEAVRTEFRRACHDALDRALQLLPDDPVFRPQPPPTAKLT
jgi:SAM-dependent methyltransferase